jgi:hypothetical protein
MKKERKRWLGGFALALGTLGTLGATVLLRRRRQQGKRMSKEAHDNYQRNPARDRWARPGMLVTFRAEIMPSRDRSERTFRVVKLLPSGRVLLEGVAGEHTEHEFEPVR